MNENGIFGWMNFSLTILFLISQSCQNSNLETYNMNIDIEI